MRMNVCICVCMRVCLSVRTLLRVACAGAVKLARFHVEASSLLLVDGSGRSLSDAASSGTGSGATGALGEGFFGKVGTFTRHGAPVAVKELKSGSLDVDSIGPLPVEQLQVGAACHCCGAILIPLCVCCALDLLWWQRMR